MKHLLSKLKAVWQESVWKEDEDIEEAWKAHKIVEQRKNISLGVKKWCEEYLMHRLVVTTIPGEENSHQMATQFWEKAQEQQGPRTPW